MSLRPGSRPNGEARSGLRSTPRARSQPHVLRGSTRASVKSSSASRAARFANSARFAFQRPIPRGRSSSPSPCALWGNRNAGFIYAELCRGGRRSGVRRSVIVLCVLCVLFAAPSKRKDHAEDEPKACPSAHPVELIADEQRRRIDERLLAGAARQLILREAAERGLEPHRTEIR